MTGQRSRRAVLAGVGSAVAALAGCSALSGGSGRAYDRDSLGRIVDDASRPHPVEFPFVVTDEQLRAHRDRIRAQVDTVPSDPSVPNEAVARELRERRESVRQRLDAVGTDEPPHRRLDRLRELRRQAAQLREAYLAATDDIDAGQVRRRRDEVRDRLSAFRAAWDYRGEGPVDAVAANAELEGHVSRVTHELEPWPPFPESVTAVPEGVGYIVGKIETAAATLTDAERFRGRLADRATGRYRPAMMATATWLRRRCRDQAASFEAVLEADGLPVDRDAADSPADHLYNLAVDAARGYTNEGLLEEIGEEGYAGAVRYATQRRAVLRALESVATQVDAGTDDPNPAVPADPSVREIEAAREQAVGAYRRAIGTAPEPIATRTVTPAYTELTRADLDVENGTTRGYELFAQYRYVTAYARATVETTAEVTHLLRSAAE